MEEPQHFQADVLIVGAGLAGLMAANWLQEYGRSVIVVDKGQEVGGRMASKNMGNGRADYGAQFFTIRDPEFQNYVNQWINEGLVFEWSKGWSDGSLISAKPDGFPRYAVRDGMRTIAQFLTQNVSVHNNVQITIIKNQSGQWQLTAQNGNKYLAKALILTPPVPQSLALLNAGSVTLTEEDRNTLARIQYAPCWSALVTVTGDVTIPAPGALQRTGETIGWIADNQQKGVSPDTKIITMHISPQKSTLWFLSPQAEIEGIFRQELRPFLTPDSTIKSIETHRWQYALPTVTHPERTLIAQNLPPLAFAGDAFDGPRVEGAALSGLTAAKKIATII